jgi:hypothetical protein
MAREGRERERERERELKYETPVKPLFFLSVPAAA